MAKAGKQSQNPQKIKDAAEAENKKNQNPAPQAPAPKPAALVSIDGAEAFDASTEEGSKQAHEIMEKAKAEGRVPMVSLNGAEALPADSPELQAAFEKLAEFPVHDAKTAEGANSETPAAENADDKKKAAKDAEIKKTGDSTTVTNPDTGMAHTTTSPANPNERFTEGPNATAPELAPGAETAKPRPHVTTENPNDKKAK